MNAERWREDLLSRTWKALEQEQSKSGQPFYTVLRCRADNPEQPAAKIAEKLSELLGTTFTATDTRQALSRARQRFEELFFAEIRQELKGATREQVVKALTELKLLNYLQRGLDLNDQDGSGQTGGAEAPP